MLRIILHFVAYNSGWTLTNDSLDSDLYYSDRLHLVEKGNMILAESILNSIEVSNGIICSDHNEFSKSYKMALSFKLNNTDFLPLPFPSASSLTHLSLLHCRLLLQGSLFPATLISGHL